MNRVVMFSDDNAEIKGEPARESSLESAVVRSQLQQRNKQFHANASARFAVDVHGTANLRETFANARDAIAGNDSRFGSSARGFLGINSQAVIGDGKFESAVHQFKGHAHFAGTGMFYSVVEDFLEREEEIVTRLGAD
jgi:hypothetical protein